jgi:uncharacterized protein (DUF1697 family)
VLIVGASSVHGQQNNNIKSLLRFDASAQLGVQSMMDVRGVHVGDNVLQKVTMLANKGGVVQYISGGNRSSKVDVVFSQPYQNSKLIQNLEIHFDKNYGFINQIDLVYTIASRYLDILPVYQQTIQQALTKYKQPLSFSDVQKIAKSTSTRPKLADVLENLSLAADVKDGVLAYFKYRNVTSKTHFVADDNGHALLLTGFQQCYFWIEKDYAEILSLCAFQPSSGNMKGQGITLSLTDFAVHNAIEDYQQGESNIDIEL